MIYAFSPNWFFQFVVQQLVCLLALQAFIIFQPYKNKFFNFVDASFFAILAAISTLSMYNYYLTKTNQKLSPWAFGIQYILIIIPLIYASLCCIYYLWKKLKSQNLIPRRREESSVTSEEDFTDNQKQYSGSYQRHPRHWLVGSSKRFSLRSGN